MEHHSIGRTSPGRQRVGGIAALAAAATFMFGFAMFATVLADYAAEEIVQADAVTFVADNQAALYAWHLVILIVFGVLLVPLVLALYERLRDGAFGIAQSGAAFGIIWATLVIAAGMIANLGLDTIADLGATDPDRAATVWSSLDVVQNGLGGGNEIVGGVWVLLVSWAGLRTGALPRALNGLGVLAGIAGVVTVVPALEIVGAVFGIGLIVWFVWVGIVMIRTGSAPTARNGSDRRRASSRVAAESSEREGVR
jgi:hypothetical protein